MAFFTKTNGLILYADNKGKLHGLTAQSYIHPHPRNDNLIIISDDTNPQETDKSLLVVWASVTVPVCADRNDLILKLSELYFGKQQIIDDSRFLDTVGDGTGTKTFTGNYSANAVAALIKPQTGKTLYINRLVVFIADSGSVDAGMYGNNITLINGIEIIHEKQTGILVKDITDGIPVKTNADYAKFGFNISDISFGSGLNHVHAVLTFSKNGTPVKLLPDEQLAVYLHDNFSALRDHTFRAGAYYND